MNERDWVKGTTFRWQTEDGTYLRLTASYVYPSTWWQRRLAEFRCWRHRANAWLARLEA